MNAKTNDLLDNMRAQLELHMSGPGLTEAQKKFCDEGIAFIRAADYELEGHEDCGPEQIAEALIAIAEEEKALAPKVEKFFELHPELFAEEEEDGDDEGEDTEES